jgi:hypothetical protein
MARRRDGDWEIDEDYQEYERGNARVQIYQATATRGGGDEPPKKKGCAVPFFFVIAPGLGGALMGLGWLVG